MNRRDLLASLPFVAMLPVIVKGKEVGKAVEINPEAKYVIFVDCSEPIETLEDLQHSNFPQGTTIHAVADIDNIRIYKV